MGMAVRSIPALVNGDTKLILGSKKCRTVRRYLYFPNKLGLTVFHNVNLN